MKPMASVTLVACLMTSALPLDAYKPKRTGTSLATGKVRYHLGGLASWNMSGSVEEIVELGSVDLACL